MGVHGLWDLIAPVGRRVSVETLAGKKLAIDASIWMIQFMKAMRDEKGEMVRNAHLLGFFRRICKLLFLRTKPVFVFDGATPALKRRTVIARRRQRENAQAKVRKTAEKLLLNHLKAMRLKELANDVVDQRKNEKKNIDKGKKKVPSDEACMERSNPERDVNFQEYEKLDEMLAASIAAEDGLGLVNTASNSAAAGQAAMVVNIAKDEEMVSETEKRKKISNGKEVLLDQTDVGRSNVETDDLRAESYYQAKLDEMLAASIAASEGGSLIKNGSTSGAVIHCEDDGQEQEEEEMILPHGNVDPSVLASLPPSMQLDLLVQMREKLMAENRQKYQEVKKVPEKFSELQIQAYLKTVAFRREIDQVQKSAAGKDLGGVHTSRIASEANREFIFSSTFTGDKELLASAGVKRDGDKQQKPQVENPTDCIDSVAASSRSSSVTGLVGNSSNDHVETYLDVAGRVRVSRVRAMGMRMTRDLERNLELMKEIELGRIRAVTTENSQGAFSRTEIDAAKSFPSENNHSRTSHTNSTDCVNNNNTSSQFQLNSKEPIQVSFEIDPEKKSLDSDDDLFTSLVAGNPVQLSFLDNGASQRDCSGSASDDDWEEGIVERSVDDYSHDLELRTNTPLDQSNISDDSEVEWEEGVCDIHENSSSPSEACKTASKGQLEEEAELQEAIRRSLEDLGNEKSDHTLSEHEKFTIFEENAFPDVGPLDQEFFDGPSMSERDGIQQDKFLSETLEIEKLNPAHQNNISLAASSPGRQFKFSAGNYPNKVGPISENYVESNSEKLSQDINEEGNQFRQLSVTQPAATSDAKDTHMNLEEVSDIFDDGRLSASSKMCFGDVTRDEIKEMEAVTSDFTCPMMVDSERKKMEAEPSIIAPVEKEPSCGSNMKTNQSVPFIELSANNSVNGGDFLKKSGGEQTYDDYFKGEKFKRDRSAIMDDDNKQDLTEASLEKEILITNQECINLENEQRKLERNAESVNIEMFAECQELLQMFGLPYIIAPMEAEAQCAYMELANLVDGVVTDDSDVFLFGARNVYKNIFDDRKYVETYFMKDIEKELGLSREKLIRTALLLGSDYTEGISGIGIVNAIEVMNAFPEENGLHEFREWIESPDPNILGKFHLRTGLNERKKGSKVGDGDTNNPEGDVEGSSPASQNNRQAHEESQADYNQEIKRTFMDKHRNVSKNWHIPSSFPSEAVVSAYTCPQVDKSTEPFRWGKPDLLVLHRLCWEKFGWDIKKSDELLLPVLKEYDKHETQLRLEAFYTFNERFAKIRSKRIKKAVKGITGKQSLVLMDDPVEEVSKNKQKRMRGIPGDNETEILSKRTDEGAPENKNKSLENSNSNKSTKRRATEKVVLPEVENPEHQSQERSRQRSWKQSHGNGRGKRLVTGRGRRNRSLGFRRDNSSSDDGNGREGEVGVGVEKIGGPLEVRRSKRTRKPVNYTVEDVEFDDAEMSAELGDEKESDKVVPDPRLTRTRETREDAASGMEQETVEHPSVVEKFSSDFLEKGGGFCIDEAEDGQVEVNQGNNAFEAEVSQDYLKMGGGFCVDDKEAGEDQNTGSVSPGAAVEETAKSPCLPTVMEASCDMCSLNSVSSVRTSEELPDVRKANALGTDTESKMGSSDATSAGDQSNASVYQPQSSVNNTGAPGVDGLSGMPFLKRKRRRN